MNDMRKTKAQLVEELGELRGRVERLESGSRGAPLPDRRLLTALVDQMLEPTVFLDFEGTVLHGNTLAAEVLELDSADEIAGMSLVDVMHPDSLARAAEDLQAVLTSEAEFAASYMLLVGGRIVHIEAHGTKLELADGPVDLVSFRDVTARRDKELLDRSNEVILKSVIDNSSTVIFIKDVDGRYILINKRYEEIFKISNEEIIGKTDFDIFPKEAAEQFQAKDRMALEAGGPVEEEELVPQRDGVHTYLSVKFPLCDAEGKAFATCGIATDITGLKQTEEELLEARKLLEERVRERTAELERINQELHEEVADREAAEEELRAEKNFFEAAVESLPGLFYVFDEQGKFLRWNRQLQDLSGYSREEIPTKHPLDFVSRRERQLIGDAVGKVFEEGRVEVEGNLITKDGDEIPYIFYGHRANIGGKTCCVGMAADISDRKKAEAALQESEEKFRGLAESTSAMIFMADHNQKIVYANRAAVLNTGYSLEQLREMSASSLLSESCCKPHDQGVQHPPDCCPRIVPEKLIALSRSMSGKEEQLFTTAEGEERWFETTGSAVDLREGRVYISTSFDITDRKRAEEALRESEERYRALIESSPISLFVHKQGGIVFANSSATAALGDGTPDYLLGKTVKDIVHPDYIDLATQRIKAVYEKDNHGNLIEEKFLRADGSAIDVEVEASICNWEGEPASQVVFRDVTDKKQAETALVASEKKFRALADSTTASIAIVAGEEPRFVYANQAMLDRAGMTWDQLSKTVPSKSLSPAALEAGTRAALEAAERGETQYRFEYEEDGRWTEVNVAKTEIDGEAANIYTSFDITEHKRALAAVEESEEKFRSLAESTTAHITIIQDDRYIYANQAFLDHFEMEKEDFGVVKPEDLMMGMMSPKTIEAAKNAWESAVKSGDSRFSFEGQDMEGGWFKTNISMVELDGKPSILGMTFDITELKRAQKELEESEKRYRTIFDTAGTGMISFGDDSVITLANEEWAKLSGYSVEETVGKLKWSQFFTDEALVRMKKYHEMRAKDPNSVPKAYEAQFRDRHGKIHDGIVNIQMVPGTHQRVASFQNMTELKRAQQQMYRADKMAALGQIIAGVAHEINNPNNFIYFNLPILRKYIEAMRPMLEHHRDENPDLKILNMPYDMFLEDVFKLLENMEHGSKRITGIVSELKNYIRSDEEKDFKVENLKTVINQVMALIGKQVRKMVKNLEVEIAEELKPTKMNPGKMEQVLINLVINAGQAADKEDSWVKVTARPSAAKSGYTEILVADNGAGIPEENLEQIFEPFFTSKGREVGTGLGLSISHQIVEEHGGTIEVESEVGRGTTFTIFLPSAG